MRLVILAVLALGLTAGACNRSDTTAPLGKDQPLDQAPAGSTATAGTAEAPRETPAREAVWHEATLPAGTELAVVLDTSVGSDTSRVEQPVEAHLSKGVSVNGEAVLPAGSQVTGVVTDASASARVKGRAHVAVRFDTLRPVPGGERYTIQTAAVGRTAPATKKNDALKIGVPAAGGAVIGAIVGGKKGALIGTAAGGGTGTAVVLATRGQEIHLAKGAPLILRLTAPVSIRVRS
jgi:hypothetical protein